MPCGVLLSVVELSAVEPPPVRGRLRAGPAEECGGGCRANQATVQALPFRVKAVGSAKEPP
ncbi:hypothetical protein Stsp02_33490 [Streptomyces sp. NBRC 14336]|nr:hypothetical protein Stsp02_33490 [Streptomyces sp. NBRC 14336]